MKKNLLVTIFLLTISLTSFASKYLPGYIVMNNQDTVRGLIEDKDWDKIFTRINFQRDANSKTETYSVSSIKSFYVSNTFYFSGVVQVDKNPRTVNDLTQEKAFEYRTDSTFVRLILSGSKSLYTYTDVNANIQYLILQDQKFEWLQFKKYLLVVNYETFQRTVNNYKSQLSDYLPGCSEVISALATADYTEKDLSAVFMNYYKCINVVPGVLHETEKFKVKLTVLGGISHTEINFGPGKVKYLSDAKFSKDTRPTIGAAINFLIPRNSYRSSINFELNYYGYDVKYDYTGTPDIFGDSQNAYSTITNSYIKAEFFYQYLFSDRPTSLFMNVGMFNAFALKVKSASHQTLFLNGAYNSESDKELFDQRSIELGFSGGLGVKRNKFLIEARYSYGTGSTSALGESTSRIALLLGYQL